MIPVLFRNSIYPERCETFTTYRPRTCCSTLTLVPQIWTALICNCSFVVAEVESCSMSVVCVLNRCLPEALLVISPTMDAVGRPERLAQANGGMLRHLLMVMSCQGEISAALSPTSRSPSRWSRCFVPYTRSIPRSIWRTSMLSFAEIPWPNSLICHHELRILRVMWKSLETKPYESGGKGRPRSSSTDFEDSSTPS